MALYLKLIVNIGYKLSLEFTLLDLTVKHHQSLLHHDCASALKEAVKSRVFTAYPYLATIKPRYKALTRILGYCIA
jgi:hypothetical protein